MRLRLGLLIIAVVAALFGTLLIALYVSGLAAQVEAGKKSVNLYVVTRHIDKNTPAGVLLDRELIKKTRIPRKYAAQGAVASLKGLERRLTAVPLDRGEQLTKSVLTLPPSGLMLPKNKLAVAVPIDQVALIEGKIKPGDHVAVMVTLKPDKEGKDSTRILLDRALVLATGGKSGKGGSATGSQAGQASLTVAATPGDAEKLVFASQTGEVWAALWPAGAKTMPKTAGQGLDSLF